jgi:hypothetical protein
MSTTDNDLYTRVVRPLPPAERLRLAARILDDLTKEAVAGNGLGFGETWTEQDKCELAAYSLQYATEVYPDDDDLV